MKLERCAVCGAQPIIRQTAIESHEHFRWHVSCWTSHKKNRSCGWSFGATELEAAENWNGQWAFKCEEDSFEHDAKAENENGLV